MKLRPIAALSALLISSGAMATSTQVYVEQNIASNDADDGIYTTEAGANIATSENGNVFIGFDDQGWLAAGYGHDIWFADDWKLNLYGELGKWDTGEEAIIDATVHYQIHDSFNLFAGVGYVRSGTTLELLSDTALNTNKAIAGANMMFGTFALDYKYTHENRDGSNGSFKHYGGETVSFEQGDFRTNEHEVILSMQLDDWTPYVKYTYFNTNEVSPSIGDEGNIPFDNDSIWTLGLAYQF